MLLSNSGTLGDTYICICHCLGITEDINIEHKTKHLYWEQEIRDIYSLLPRVKSVDVNDTGSWGASPYAYIKHKVDEFDPFPNFKFPASKLAPGEPYTVLCPKSGKPSEQGRRIRADEIKRIEDASDMPVVIPEPGKTTLLEAMGLVARANRFYGVQGLMSYVALSHKTTSVVYVPNSKEWIAFRSRLASQWMQFLDEVKMK